jgi:hypothetical protein
MGARKNRAKSALPGPAAQIMVAHPAASTNANMSPGFPTQSAEFIDGVGRSIQAALDSLFQHENALTELLPTSAEPEQNWSNAITRLETTVCEWQAILDTMGEQVRVAQEELTQLDSELNRSLGMFAAARKHLQGEANDLPAA